ncbi:MAG: phosphoribosylformylglycinamidine synthase subunit PurL [Ilumatobacter sp.]|nr:MAG: phosphoribosylformylglycinamidine synthase subunit PurL [Ilumatobacter sp.]
MEIGHVEVSDIVFALGALSDEHLAALESLLVEPLLQTSTWETPGPEARHAIEITLLPGVTDAGATTLLTAAERLHVPLDGAATGRRIIFAAGTDPELAEEVVRRVVANPIIERWGPAPVEPPTLDDTARTTTAVTVPMRGLSATELGALGELRSLALDPEELLAVQAHFEAEGRDPTDVELETIAQTWSEHCAHKTFRAALTTDDGIDRPPMLVALRDCTDTIAAPFVRSAFVGNAGIVSYRDGITVALKAETHNHPSAVEPFGGANTGVGGVIRDVLGAAHRPVAVTDVLCFGPPDISLADVPDGSLHPRRIREGVIDGVADYGNKIGLPTVAGAILYDPGFTTNPLVFAGCIGVAAERDPHDGPGVGDRVVVLGGRTGRDGIRGATFSSLTMDATTGTVAGASVQIGDPITEKLLIDVLVGAEHLYSAITDCGAGGLSSAVGEMAEGVGADVELDLVPLKYAGLEPWEIWLSEAQERMVVAVPTGSLAELQARCDAAGVEMSDIGHFTGDQRLVVRSSGRTVLDLRTDFLHDGRPQRQMTAEMPTPSRTATGRTVDDPRAVLLALLAHRNIASKAGTIHRYDHEIGGATLVRPLVGVEGDAPADGVLLAAPLEAQGLAIGIGVNPWYGLHDPEAMARAVVDEAIRNVVAVGADPDRVSLLDNFSWGDPRRPSTLGELVAAVDGCCAGAAAHAAPFVSGKDSLNNEYTGSDGRRHAVPPTLVITAVAHHPDVERRITPVLRRPGNVLVLLGATAEEFAGSHLDLVLGEPDHPGIVPQSDPTAPVRYRRLHRVMMGGLVEACHDVSEGGLAVALAEMCIAGRLGVRVEVLPHPDLAVALFAESTGRFLLEVAPGDLPLLEDVLDDAIVVLGEVTDEPILSIAGLAPIDVSELVDAFTSHGAHP